MSNDCRMIVYIKLSYLSLYLRAGRSFDVKGAHSYFEKAESIFKPSTPPPPQIHPRFLEMTLPHSLLPPINFIFCECDSPLPPLHILAINRAEVHCVVTF